MVSEQGGVVLPRTAQLAFRDAACGDYRLFVAWPREAPPAAGWPVLYHLDGNADFGTFVDSARAQTARAFRTGVMPGLVVGIGYPTEAPIDMPRRCLDYTPDVPDALRGDRPNGQPWPETGGAARFHACLAERIMPAIATRFPVDPSRQSLFGHSLGGLFALYSLITAPGLFASYSASSPSLWWGERHLFGLIDAMPPIPRPVRVALTVGGLEQPDSGDDAHSLWHRRNRVIGNARDFCARLAEVPGIDARFTLFEGEDHGSVVPSAVSRAIRLAFTETLPP